MPTTLRLEVTDYLDSTRWRWVLSDSHKGFLADHQVQLDPTTHEYAGFKDVSTYLNYYEPIHPPEQQLRELGAWIGTQVFGGLQEKLRENALRPAVAVQVIVPQQAQELLFRPFELARFAAGTGIGEAGIRFVYDLEGAATKKTPGTSGTNPVRILAAFSLPVKQNPLNLRRERVGLQRLVRALNQTQNLAVDLRVLQYGATRDTLRKALEEAEGWDIIQLSGHGQQGELLLENDSGGSDTIKADDLADLLELAKEHLKLLILDACYSGANSHAAARVQVGLDRIPERQEVAEGAPVSEANQTELPSLAQTLSHRLDCAAVAMRYPVGDAFATELMLSLYEKLLVMRRPLPAALHLALDEALKADIPRPHLSAATPILVGVGAAELRIVPSQQANQEFGGLPQRGLGIAFPPEPERFVGRLQPMLRASQALAVHSPKRGVLFHGMPGAGKTASALELAYRHEKGRFRGYVWYAAPEAGNDISNALFNFVQDIQTQLNAPGLGLTTALDNPQQFRQYTLPRLRAMLSDKSVLLVLDNLETLLSASDNWRDPLWGEVVTALLAHDGSSRVVITSRRVPAGLGNHPKLQVEPIHALSFAESVLLARDLPNLKKLFDDETGRELLQKILRVAQGHPKLLELADGLAADRSKLAAQVAAADSELADRADVLDSFFARGDEKESETRQTEKDFVRTLQGWTTGVAGTLSQTARLLFTFLCRLEPEDRRQSALKDNWEDFLKRLGEGHAVAAALAEPEQGLPPALAALEAAGLVGVERPTVEQIEAFRSSLVAQEEVANVNPAARPAYLQRFTAQTTTYTIHPGVAETERAAADPTVLAAADIELGDYHLAACISGSVEVMQGGGVLLIHGARNALPYLMRQKRWTEAAGALEQILRLDQSPDTVAFALPPLRRIAQATVGTVAELYSAKALASALIWSDRSAEAEPILRDLIARASPRGEHRLASTAAGDLINLLRRSGRLAEALRVAAEKAGHAAQAGLGPWTQLGVATQRLQVLAEMGRYDEVLECVEAKLAEIEKLPHVSEAEETAAPWQVRSLLLDSGFKAAMDKEQWEKALRFNAEVLRIKEGCGLSARELAGIRFNNHGPLLHLRRFDESRSLLQQCRSVFQKEHDVKGLGLVFGGLAELESETGDLDAAVNFGELALAYNYQLGDPQGCATGHNALASFLHRRGAEPVDILTHVLADAVLCLQMGSGGLRRSIRSLALLDLSAAPRTFDEVADRVEAIEGVRFKALFDRLPRTVPDGDAALAALGQLVAEERQRIGRFPGMAKVLAIYEPLLEEIAAATADESLRAMIEPKLVECLSYGWPLIDPVHRLWAGERDLDALTRLPDGQQTVEGVTLRIDSNSAQLVHRILELVKQGEAEGPT